ncbi:hypothetical protein WA026_000956 [Henosepilachna vigintioctopunctata]|uniref:Activating molecule in BECN1-regulated autophagy protein 1 n=1 Tax=Henosepilachna vigintioctopunctata TaxID=420089 RepID=A0AAW1V258_9CUCU
MNSKEPELFRHPKRREDQNSSQNVLKILESRTLGHLRDSVKSNDDIKLYAEEEFIRKNEYDEQLCEMPGMPRSTFLMVFSPDGKKVASTHGNHNIYVTDLTTGKNIKTLVGHPRTPWCVAFHPTSNQIVASGCLGGQVRIWDLSGGSEVWTAENQSVIASIAFHPSDRILVIATINEIHFWDWNESKPFCYTATSNQKEKVRYVAFDKLGHKLITGISNSQSRWEYVRTSVPSPRPVERSQSPYRRRITHRIFNFPIRRSAQQTSTSNNNIREPPSTIPQRERNISLCYRNLVREYARLVRRYLHLYRPPAMVDRGTDPMEENTFTSTSSTQVPEHSSANQPGPSTLTEDNSSTSNHDESNDNPYQFLTPSRIVAVMNRPATFIRGTQTSELRKHKAGPSSDNDQSTSEKKLKTHCSSVVKAPEETNTSMTTDTGQPQTAISNALVYISDQSEEEHVLEDIIRGAPSSRVTSDDLSTSQTLEEENIEFNDPVLEPNVSNLSLPEELAASISSNNYQISVNRSQSTNQNHDSNVHENYSHSTSESIPDSGNNFSKKITKITPGCSTDKSGNGISSSPENSEHENNNGKKFKCSTPQPTANIDGQSRNAQNAGDSITTSIDNRNVDYSIPGTSRDDTGRDSRVSEDQRFELMMASIRHDAEDNLKSKFLPLIRSVPREERFEMIRIFVQGLRESREKVRMKYRNFGMMLNKKTNRRPIPGTSSDTSSSEDEQDSLNATALTNEILNDRRIDESSNLPEASSISLPLEQRTESNRDAFRNINNLENWVSSLFSDSEPQTNLTNNSESGTTGDQTSTAVPISSAHDNSLSRPTRINRLLTPRRLYSHRLNRDRTHSRNSSISSRMPSASVSAVSNSSNSAGLASTRTSGSTFARRRFGVHRASAFLPTRVYYPRNPPEARRNRQFLLGRWRLNPRSYRSYIVSDRFNPRSVASNNSSNFATDEVINFSEFPNSEDDPVPSLEGRTAPSPSFYSYNFHPFNPPPDLPSINPENIGIGNMYSNIVQDLEVSLNDVRNIRASNRPGEMSDMLNNFSERLENIMNQSETILRNLRTSVEMLPGTDLNSNGERISTPSASFNDENFYVRDQRIEVNDLQNNSSILDENPSSNVASDHTYPRNSESSGTSSNSHATMSPLMTSLHLTISHIQRQASLLRQQVGSIERIDRAMVEVAQLQLIRLLLVELSRYVRNMSGESRSTSMSSVRQMMAGTRISDSSPSESQSSDNGGAGGSALPPQPSTSNPSNAQNNMPSARTRGLSHKTYPPSRLNRLHKRRTMLVQNVPRHLAVRLPPVLRRPSVTLTLDRQSMFHIYSRINSLTLCRMSRRLDELISEQVKVFMQRQVGQTPTILSDSNIREQNIGVRLRDSIARTNRLVGNIFNANVVRNYRMETSTVSIDGFDRLYARQTLSFIIDGISTHLDETRSSPLPHNIRLELQNIMTVSLLLSELLLLQIVDSIPPANGTSSDINLDQERLNLISRINQMCTTMMLSSRLGDYSIHLTHSLRQLQALIRQNSNLSQNNVSNRAPSTPHVRNSEGRIRITNRANRVTIYNRSRNTLRVIPARIPEPTLSNQTSTSGSNENGDTLSRDSESLQNRIQTFREMQNSFHNLHNIENQSDQHEEDGNTLTDDNTELSEDNANIGTRLLEARARVFQRDILERVRNSVHPSSNSLTERYQHSPPQNSESDDGSRQTIDQRRNRQMTSTSSDLGSRRGNSFSIHQTEEDGQSGRWSLNFPFATSRPIAIMTSRFPSNSSSTSQLPTNNPEGWSGASRWSWNLPSVQVNDVPLSDLGSSQENSENNSPSPVENSSLPNPMNRTNAMRTGAHSLGVFRPRFLHPMYSSVNPFDADLDDPQREHIYDSDVITTVTPNHRIQIWDISDSTVPNISNPLKNVVVGECKIHNDASVDIASDGSILVTLLPSGGYLNVTNRLGVYSLKWETLGQCLYTTNFDYNAVSVSLSPSGRHLVVGLASRRVSIVPSERWIMARIFKIEQKDIPGDRLPIIKEIDQARDGRATSHKSVNCIRWLPSSGQGLIYATNTGQLVIWT